MQKIRILLLVLSVFPSVLYSQVTIIGTVLDKETNEPLHLSSVCLDNSRIGTITNEDGEFKLSVDKLPVVLKVSQLGFETEKVVIDSSKPAVISLKYQSITLKEVVIGNTALFYLNSAIEKSLKDIDQSSFFKGYLRSSTIEKKKIKSFNEIYFDAKFNTAGIELWKPTQMRYAIEEKKFYDHSVYFNLNTSFFRTGVVSTNLALPYSNKSDKKNFNFEIKRFYNNGEDEIVEIQCTPKSKELPYFEGTIAINVNTYNIVKIGGTYYQKLDKEDIAKNRNFKYTVNFSEKSDAIHFKDFSMVMTTKIKNMTVERKTFICSLRQNEPEPGLISVSKYPEGFRDHSYDENFWNSRTDNNYSSGQEEAVAIFNRMKKFYSNF